VTRWWFRPPVAFVNARVVTDEGLAPSLRFAKRVLGVGGPPRRGDVVVDLDGAFVLPGLINAHDHLELNHYGRLKCKERYENASAWIDDMRPRLQSDPSIRMNRTHPLGGRLFIGGLKNLLAGVTTVAHHNPPYRELSWSTPVRVIRKYGWAHSFLLEGQPVGARGEPGGDVSARYQATSPDAPFIVHIAEGVDMAAAAEVDRLDALGCLRRNTVLVHGVAMTTLEWRRVVGRGAGLVWCPASNQFLFGRTAPVRQFLDHSDRAAAHLCLGSDSRVTGARDLLDELRVAASLAPVTPRELLRMVTASPAGMLRVAGAGRLAPGARADLLVIPPTRSDAASALLETSRDGVSLVMIDGRPMVGELRRGDVFAARGHATRRIVVDGVEKIADARLAQMIARSPIREPGVECRS
jgi:Amidohydrolase family